MNTTLKTTIQYCILWVLISVTIISIVIFFTNKLSMGSILISIFAAYSVTWVIILVEDDLFKTDGRKL